MTPHTDKGVVAGVDESERSGREGSLIEVVWNYSAETGVNLFLCPSLPNFFIYIATIFQDYFMALFSLSVHSFHKIIRFTYVII